MTPDSPVTSRQELHREILENFRAVLSSLDFRYELELLGISPWHFKRSNRLKKECEAQVVGLWRLALERSFPGDWQEILERFIAERRAQFGNDKNADADETRIREQISLLERKREEDFTVPATHLIECCGIPQADCAVPRLKIALHLRKLYTLIFNRLI